MVCNCNQIIDFPLFFHSVTDNANIGNGINFGYGYDFSFDYGNGFTSTVTEKLTSNYWAESTCSDNRYSYCFNNPLIYSDPDGENPVLIAAIIIGATAGGYTGYKIGEAKGATGWSMVGYIAGGAVIGGVSGYMGATIAAGGGFMANTMSIMYSSYFNSIGMTMLSGGMMQPSISFGFGSFDFGTGKFNSIFNWKNLSTMEKIGYSLGAMSNLNDLWNVAFPNQKGTNLYTDKDDPIISHTAWGDSETNGIISFGPNRENPFFYENLKAKGVNALSFGNETVGEIKSYGKFGLGLPRRSAYWRYDKYNNWELAVSNINKVPLKGVSYFSKILPYQGLTLNCVNIGSLGAWLSGIPNVGVHPWLFHGSMWLYNAARFDLYGHYLLNF